MRLARAMMRSVWQHKKAYRNQSSLRFGIVSTQRYRANIIFPPKKLVLLRYRTYSLMNWACIIQEKTMSETQSDSHLYVIISANSVSYIRHGLAEPLSVCLSPQLT